MSSVTFSQMILAVITVKPDRVSGGAPIFIAKNQAELEKMTFTLEKCLDGLAHELDPHTMFIVRHG